MKVSVCRFESYLSYISRYQSGLMAQSAKLLIRKFKSHPRVTAMELCDLHVK